MHPFKKLILVSLGKESQFEKIPSAADWAMLFRRAKFQTMLGVLYQGLIRLPDEQLPPEHIKKEWSRLAGRIEDIHALHEKRVKEMEGLFRKLGLRGCILKGTGLSHLYPKPSARQSGDIDVWVEGTHRSILKKLQSRYNVWNVLYQECKVDFFDDVIVEVHFHPSKMYNPFCNARLQRWLEANGPFSGSAGSKDGSRTGGSKGRSAAGKPGSGAGTEAGTECGTGTGTGTLTYPTARFNAVFCMAHMFRHYLEGGIGFRQMMDYYYLLQVLDPDDRAEVMKVFRRTGMARFAGAVMHVLKYTFRLEDEFMLCPPDRKYGSPMIREILVHGNFGVLDKRNYSSEGETVLGRFRRKNARVLSKLRDYPRQVIWSPFARIGQFIWRLFNGYL